MTGFALFLRFWPYALIAALVLLVGGQQVRVSHAKAATAAARAETANLETKYAQAAARAEADARAEENRRTEATRKVVADAQSETAAAQSAAADAVRAADGLRARVNALVAASRQGSGNPSAAGRGAGQQGQDTIDVLAKLYSESDDRAQSVSVYADALRISGQACERWADALTNQR